MSAADAVIDGLRAPDDGTARQEAVVQYKCTGTYNPAAEGGIQWNDPALEIDWPSRCAQTSDKDRDAPTLAEWLERPESDHFRF